LKKPAQSGFFISSLIGYRATLWNFCELYASFFLHSIMLRYYIFIVVFFLGSATYADVSLYSNHTIGKIGTEVTFDIQINGFTDIIACQASINWDAALIKFTGVSDFGIQYLTIADFGTTNAEKGHIRFLWEPDDAVPVTKSDSVIMFKIHFELLSGAGQTTNISFIDNQFNFPVEFANANYVLLPFISKPGTVALYNQPGDVIKIISNPNTSCDTRNPSGSLSASVNGDITNFKFWWYLGSVVKTTPDFIGYNYEKLAAGDYTLEVADMKNAVQITTSSVIMDNPVNRADTIAVIMNLPQTSCKSANGKLEVSVNKDQPANRYDITWWKGTLEDGDEMSAFQNSYVADPLSAGNYEVKVENTTTGCISYLQTIIIEELPDMTLSFTTTGNQFCKDSVNGTATAILANESAFDPLYFWFYENDPIDTANASYKGKTIENLSVKNYNALVIDLITECKTDGMVEVVSTPYYTPASVTQEGDTLFASYDQSNWLFNGSLTSKTGPYLVPDKTGDYSITFYNEFNCFCTSDPYSYRITGLEASVDGITIYPNPFAESIRISNPKGIITSIQVFDSQGRLYFESFNIKNPFTDIRLSASDKGVYFVKILKDNVIETKKMVRVLAP